jgi:hypothetical protein
MLRYSSLALGSETNSPIGIKSPRATAEVLYGRVTAEGSKWKAARVRAEQVTSRWSGCGTCLGAERVLGGARPCQQRPDAYGFWRGLADEAVARYLDCGVWDNG